MPTILGTRRGQRATIFGTSGTATTDANQPRTERSLHIGPDVGSQAPDRCARTARVPPLRSAPAIIRAVRQKEERRAPKDTAFDNDRFSDDGDHSSGLSSTRFGASENVMLG